MESEATRQMLGTVFIALADAAGPDVMDRAVATISRAIEVGAVPDEFAKASLKALVRSCQSNPL